MLAVCGCARQLGPKCGTAGPLHANKLCSEITLVSLKRTALHTVTTPSRVSKDDKRMEAGSSLRRHLITVPSFSCWRSALRCRKPEAGHLCLHLQGQQCAPRQDHSDTGFRRLGPQATDREFTPGPQTPANRPGGGMVGCLGENRMAERE